MNTLHQQLQTALATVYKLQERTSSDKKERAQQLASWERRLTALLRETYEPETAAERAQLAQDRATVARLGEKNPEFLSYYEKLSLAQAQERIAKVN